MQRLAAWSPEGLLSRLHDRLGNFMPQVELYAVIDHAEPRYGDEKLENVSRFFLAHFFCPPRCYHAPVADITTRFQILSIVAEELPAPPVETNGEADAAAEAE